MIDPTITADELLVQESARKLLEAECPIELVRSLRDRNADGSHPALWSRLADAGWLGLVFPEELGGGGGSLFDLALFQLEAGRVLLPTTFASTILAGLTILHLGTESQRRDLLPRICSGEAIATVAYLEPAVEHDLGRMSTRATRDCDGCWVLSGTKSFDAYAGLSDIILVVASVETASGGMLPAVFVLDGADLASVEVKPLATFGGDRQDEIEFSRTTVGPRALLGGPDLCPGTRSAFDGVLELATAMQAVEMAGGMAYVVETTSLYVSQREQFGRPIGSFQAVQHHVADIGMLAEGARLLALRAAWLLAEGLPASIAVSQAKAWCSDAYPRISLIAHQLHGGMGYVAESALPLYSARAKTAEVSLGSSAHHIDRVAAGLGI